jgi:hypothetical protein
MRVSTDTDDPGYVPGVESVKFSVFLDGVEQNVRETGRAVFVADEEEGFIRFHQFWPRGSGNLASDDYLGVRELRGRVEVRHKDGEMPMRLRGFGT